MNDYFTVDEFRAFAGEKAGGASSEEEIAVAQEEVITDLEAWAQSAWPNVTGTDGDGEAELPRSKTIDIPSGSSVLFLHDVPLIEVSAFTFSTLLGTPTVLDPAEFPVHTAGGAIRVPAIRRGSGFYSVTYSYGYTSCPQAIKRPAMAATLALLKHKVPSNIPANTAQMTTEGTTFVFAQPGSAFSSPWPWDAESSEAVRSYWGRNRPRRAGAA